MNLDSIPIYAVHEADGELVGFSFDAQPGSAEPDRVHTPIDREAPGSDLFLYAYRTFFEAVAFTHGLELAQSNDNGCLIHTFDDNLTCVLIDFICSTSDALHIEDMRPDNPAGAGPLRALISGNPGMTNEERAEHAAAAVAEYLSMKGERHDLPAEDYEISDLICDLLHHGDLLGFNYRKLIDCALLHYEAEKKDEPPTPGSSS